jgi:hypothetical protein
VKEPHAAHGGFHERATTVKPLFVFSSVNRYNRLPTNGRRRGVLPIFLSKKGLAFPYRRIALLPFALLVERFAPVPVGVLN